MRVLFSFAGGLGHANPMVPVARASARAGHEVAFAGRRSATEVLQEQGFEVFVDPSGDQVEARVVSPLEEIDMEARAAFLAAGGTQFHYIPCLNDQHEWMAALAALAMRHLQGWPTGLTAPSTGLLRADATTPGPRSTIDTDG